MDYIQIAANSYFWVFLILGIIDFFYTFTEDYKRKTKILESLGKLPNGITFSTLISWTLFITSIQLK